MKKTINILTGIIAVILILICPVKVFAADDDYEAEIQQQVDSMLEDYGISYDYSSMESLSAGGILDSIKERLEGRLKAPFASLGLILVIILFSSFVQITGETAVLQGSSLNMYRLVGVLSASAVILPPMLEACISSANALNSGGNFMLVFVPVFAGISAASGGLTSVGVYNGITLTAAELMVQTASELLMPLLTMTIALSVCGSIFGNDSVESLVQTVRKIMVWTMTVAVTLFTGFVSLKCTLGGAVDGFAVKTVKYMVSGFVPIVGGAVSDAYGAVKGSFDVIRCTAGTAGTIGIIILMFPPIAELAAFRGVLWAAKAASGMFSVNALDRLFKSLDAGLSIAMSILVSFSVLFVISTGILMKSMG